MYIICKTMTTIIVIANLYANGKAELGKKQTNASLSNKTIND